MHYYAPGLLIFLIALSAYAAGFTTYHVSQSDSLEASQKRAIYLFVWLIPLIGPAITLAALGDDLLRQKRHSRIPLLGYIFLAASLSPGQDEERGSAKESSSVSTGNSDGAD